MPCLRAKERVYPASLFIPKGTWSNSWTTEFIYNTRSFYMFPPQEFRQVFNTYGLHAAKARRGSDPEGQVQVSRDSLEVFRMMLN